MGGWRGGPSTGQSRRPESGVQRRRPQGAIHLTSSFRVAAPLVAGGWECGEEGGVGSRPSVRPSLPASPDLYCNLSRSLLQLTFPAKYQLWPPAGPELKGSSANLTGPVRCHLAGRAASGWGWGRGRGRHCLSTSHPPPAQPLRARRLALLPSARNSLLITLQRHSQPASSSLIGRGRRQQVGSGRGREGPLVAGR